jgi:hypothetical protein
MHHPQSLPLAHDILIGQMICGCRMLSFVSSVRLRGLCIDGLTVNIIKDRKKDYLDTVAEDPLTRDMLSKVSILFCKAWYEPLDWLTLKDRTKQKNILVPLIEVRQLIKYDGAQNNQLVSNLLIAFDFLNSFPCFTWWNAGVCTAPQSCYVRPPTLALSDSLLNRTF